MNEKQSAALLEVSGLIQTATLMLEALANGDEVALADLDQSIERMNSSMRALRAAIDASNPL